MLAVMRDEEYAAEDIPSYGAHEQLAIVTRTRRHLRTTLLGVLVACLGAVLATVALLSYPDIDGVHAGRGWVLALLACSTSMAVLCLWQHLAWRRAEQVWHGERGSDLGAVVAVSWILHLLSYAVALIGLIVGVVGLVEVGRYATTAGFVVLALVALFVGQVLAGVQYVRAEGPPGALPARMRVSHEH